MVLQMEEACFELLQGALLLLACFESSKSDLSGMVFGFDPPQN